MRWLAALSVLAGCDYALGLTEHDPVLPFDPTQCPATYESVPTLTSRYRLEKARLELSTAAFGCASDDDDRTHLVVLDTPSEAIQLDAYIKRAMLTEVEDYVFIGLIQDTNATKVDEGWRWVTDTPYNPFLWRSEDPIEPDDSGDFIEMHREQAAAWSMGGPTAYVDLPERSTHWSLCECDGKPSR